MYEFDLSAVNSLEELQKYLPKELDSKELELINAAYKFAQNIHGDTLRISGESQMSHVLTVAKYVAELNLDVVSIVAAILHDVLERSPVSMNEIDKQFGTDVAFIVDGLSHIRKLSQNVEIDEDHLDLENFKRLIFSATEDVRILIVRLLEKLHSLINISSLSEEKQKRAAERALKIYGPLAEYLGLGIVQALIEEHAFKILKPNEYKIITEEIESYFKSSQNIFSAFENEITDLLNQYDIKCYPIQVRKKGIYSAYLKIKRKFLSDGVQLIAEHVRNLFDIYAARIIVDSIEECYMVLGLVQSKYGIKPEEFNDYISMPKSNGYKSIHLLLNYMGTTLELQIRTKEMHEYNEYGPASHILYKLKAKGENGNFTLTEDLLKWQEKGSEKYRIKLFADSVFVFTPKGLVIRLDKGSTPIDFAFRIHTDIGYKYVGAKVNAKMVSMDYKLQTGDVVEIIIQKKDNVTLDWLKHAFMTETKARIRRRL